MLKCTQNKTGGTFYGEQNTTTDYPNIRKKRI